MSVNVKDGQISVLRMTAAVVAMAMMTACAASNTPEEPTDAVTPISSDARESSTDSIASTELSTPAPATETTAPAEPSEPVATESEDPDAVAQDSGRVASTPHFRTPSGKIECLGSRDQLRCELTTGQPINPLPEPSEDCALDWGNGLVLSRAGSVEVLCAGDTIRMADTPEQPVFTLPYSQPWRYEAFACVVEPVGLTCRNASQQGFFLSTQNWEAVTADAATP